MADGKREHVLWGVWVPGVGFLASFNRTTARDEPLATTNKWEARQIARRLKHEHARVEITSQALFDIQNKFVSVEQTAGAEKRSIWTTLRTFFGKLVTSRR
jgi:hypothetical protein